MTYYLDAASTTKPCKVMLEKIAPYFTELWHNPSSLYSQGKRVKDSIERVRQCVAYHLGAEDDEIYFTSGATESNNWVVRGFDDAHIDDKSLIIATEIEHNSIIKAVKNKALRSKVYLCPVDDKGFVDKHYLCCKLAEYADYKTLVSVIMANNEIGTIQDIASISDIVHAHNGILHVDATQAFGHIPIDVKTLGIDLLSASGQKFGGIKGCGFLYKRNGVDICPLIYGEQEHEQRGGTENVVGIMSLYAAMAYIDYKKDSDVADIRDYFIDRLEEIGCVLNGSRTSRLSNNVNVMLPNGIGGEEMLHCLSLSNILISTGSACNSHSIEPSHVLKAIGLSNEDCARCIRITIPEDFKKESVDYVVDEIKKCILLMD